MKLKKSLEAIAPKSLWDYLFVLILIWGIGLIAYEAFYDIFGTEIPHDWIYSLYLPLSWLIPEDAGIGAGIFIQYFIVFIILGTNVLAWILKILFKKGNPLFVTTVTVVIVVLVALASFVGNTIESARYKNDSIQRNERARLIDLAVTECKKIEDPDYYKFECNIIVSNAPNSSDPLLTVYLEDSVGDKDQSGTITLTPNSKGSYSGQFKTYASNDVLPIYIYGFTFYDNFDRYERFDLKIAINLPK